MTDLSRPCFTFDGETVPFRPGQTVGAALMQHGIRAWRTTRLQHRPRGIFCGIGVCFDCLITIDGQRTQRACLTPAVEGAVVCSADPDEPVSLRESSSRGAHHG